MTGDLLRISRQRAGAILLLIAVLAAGGAVTAARLPSSIFPSVTFPLVKVIADVGEEPAARMMPTVTRPLEEAILRVPGVGRVLSTTSRGSTEIAANFAWGTDMQVALQRVQAEVARIRPDLPSDAKIDVEWMNTAVFPILGYALTSSSQTPSELWALAEYRLKPELIRIPGVSQIQIQGGRKREFQVRLDPDALAARRLSPADVVTAIRKNNQILSAGLTEANHELYLSLVDGLANGIDALSRIPIPIPGGGVPAHVGELGKITAADAVSYIRTTADGRPAVLVNIIRQPSANTVAIADGVRRLFAERPSLIPSGVAWTTFYDQAEFVSRSVRGVRDAILIGVGLAAIVLLVFLRNIRLTLVAVATVPICVAIALLLLGAAGQTVNLMTLGGIAAALGLIADDAIVVVENIHRHRQEGAPDPTERGLRELLPALAGSSLSTVVIFLPFALLSGVAGAFFRPLALTMALALTVSFLLAALAVPVGVGATPPRASFTREMKRGAASRFDRAISLFLRRPWIAGVVLIGLFLSGVLLYRAIGTDFLPAMDEGSIILDYWTPPGTSLSDTDTMLLDAERIIQALPDVQSYSRRTGTQLGFFITEPNRGDYVIKLKPRARRRSVDEVIEDLRARIAAAEPAIHTDFGQLLEDNIADLTGGVPQPVDVKIFGEDQALLQEAARRAAKIISAVPGVEDVFDGIVIAGPALNIRLRSSLAEALPPGSRPGTTSPPTGVFPGTEPSRFGLTTEDLHASVEPAVTGTVAGTLHIGERVYDLRVFAQGRGGLDTLRVRTPSGAWIPLTAVATIETGPPEAEIDRENLKTYLGVIGRLSGRDLGRAIAEIRQKLDNGLALPPETSLQFGGLYEQQQNSFKGLLLVLVGGLLLVSIVLLFEFGDWRAPVLTGLIALAVLAGVFAALLLTGMTLNISSFVGAIMMVGIVGENAIFVIHEARLELRRGASVPEAWRLAARRRLRPVAMTILATALALGPLAVALGEGSQLQQPLAIAVIGGFLLSGPLVLLVLPALYCVWDPRGRLAGDTSA
jgi:multidrug efflux pump subunit AcrB